LPLVPSDLGSDPLFKTKRAFSVFSGADAEMLGDLDDSMNQE
jgi:hypothetical protein